jgi:hypothetical protein
MSQNKPILILIAVALLGILTVMVVNSANRTPGEKISDGAHEIGQGVSDAVNRATH